jgi:hypothetical protein
VHEVDAEVVRLCHGLPLALAMVGGLVRSAKGDAARAWQSVAKQIQAVRLHFACITVCGGLYCVVHG